MFIEKPPVQCRVVGDLGVAFIQSSTDKPILAKEAPDALDITSWLYHRCKLHRGLAHNGCQHGRTFTECFPGLILSGKVAMASKMQADIALLIVEQFMMKNAHDTVREAGI